MLRGKRFGNGTTEPPVAVVLLAADYGTGLPRTGYDSICIQRLDGVYVDQVDADAFFLELAGSLYRVPDQVAGSEDGHVGTFVQLQGLTDLKLGVFRNEDGPARAAEA